MVLTFYKKNKKTEAIIVDWISILIRTQKNYSLIEKDMFYELIIN